MFVKLAKHWHWKCLKQKQQNSCCAMYKLKKKGKKHWERIVLWRDSYSASEFKLTNNKQLNWSISKSNMFVKQICNSVPLCCVGWGSAANLILTPPPHPPKKLIDFNDNLWILFINVWAREWRCLMATSWCHYRMQGGIIDNKTNHAIIYVY